MKRVLALAVAGTVLGSAWLATHDAVGGPPPLPAFVHTPAPVALVSLPINPDWIIDGDPVASGVVGPQSTDGLSSTWIWECTPGRFRWHYDRDEHLTILRGSVTLDEGLPTERKLAVGDSVYFPAGSSATWHVTETVRKIAFLRHPMPKPFLFVLCAARSVKRLIRR